MTAMRDRVSIEEDTDEGTYDVELPIQLDDDDFFEPTIIRGRE
ncbi:hypothetical protein KIPE111705_10665 [Kibdelosporangium persicum]|uniref:Uncharacterized protein n=1 Tax=Kibdelosporangium persicum TaxID=2698649 RepID=A0ABX2EZV5_9PSEU|nr:hypothetical protein [Kibdelosporangium persicum]NRN64232.1 hypothetical protein [Kibdelosporangium persicum]